MPYTHGHSEAVLASHRWRSVANSAAYLASRLAPSRSLLDVGCGPGTLTLDLARHVAPGRVVGVDNAPVVLEEARKALAGDELPNVAFEQADVYSLPFDDGSFEIVHAHQLCQHLAEPVRALEEMARVCRPGGVVAVRDADYASFTWWPADERLERWLELYRAIARADGGEPDAGRRLKQWAHRAGLRNGLGSASAWCFSSEEERRWWGDLWAERTRSSRLAERGVELGLTTGAELEELAHAWDAWARRPEGWFAVLHGELLCEL